MPIRFRVVLVLTLVLSLVLAIPVFAGGWAVITVDDLPMDVVAGRPITVGFTVLQHGETPMNDLEPTITISLKKGQEIVVDAKPDGKSGHYTATLTFPNDGEWDWSIQAFTMDQMMPPLIVAAPDVAAAGEPVVKSERITKPVSTLDIVRLSALGIGLVGMVFAFRRKSRFAVALTVFCLLVGVASFVASASVPKVEAQGKSSNEIVAKPSSITQVELGGELFVAKGCVTCHVNNKVTNASEYWTIDMGAPNLSNFSASPEVLQIRLKNPVEAKSDTKMPNLGLKEAEIEALIAFINSK